MNDVVFVMTNSKLAKKKKNRKAKEYKFDDIEFDNEWIVNNDDDFENEILDFTIENDDFEVAFAEGGNGIDAATAEGENKIEVATAEGGNGIEAATVKNELEIHNLDDEFDGEEGDSCLDDQNSLKDLLNDIF